MSSFGICSSHTASYSPDTVKMLNLLMEEAKVNLSQRQKIKEKMLAGDPLPSRKKSALPLRMNDNIFDLKKNYYFRKRSVDVINASASQHEVMHVHKPRVDREKEKQDLQNLMAFGKKSANVNNSKKLIKLTKDDRLEELTREIDERMEFIKNMTELGLRSQYANQIQEEVATKLREIEIVQQMTPEDFANLNIIVKK